ncbi:MAG TPA: LUD domain-containing protein [Pirellulales bacterium]|jgi:L-lactate dehydrogenase complex protein LldG|nr:LUD domain-containing protein [Pirellulales bacterium]
MSTKQAILDRIRKHLPQATELPALDLPAITFPDPVAQFSEVLASVGGSCLSVAEDLAQAVRTLPCFASARQIVCQVEGLPLGNKNLSEIADPHDLNDVDLAIMPGDFAVAENGAVWVSDRSVRHRAIYFLAQHLVLVVARAHVIDNLHQAYARLEFAERGYGLFISGPSKTADIEQSLVIGAHGPRSLTVLVVGGL